MMYGGRYSMPSDRHVVCLFNSFFVLLLLSTVELTHCEADSTIPRFSQALVARSRQKMLRAFGRGEGTNLILLLRIHSCGNSPTPGHGFIGEGRLFMTNLLKAPSLHPVELGINFLTHAVWMRHLSHRSG